MNRKVERREIRATVVKREALSPSETRITLFEHDTNSEWIWLATGPRAAKVSFGATIVVSALVKTGLRSYPGLQSVRFIGRW